MSTYLQIAEAVLHRARRPMSAKAIMKKAYAAGLVPDQLYGKTQHKTLQARLSEDILSRRERSPFFRTEPGVFFLREFLTDPKIPMEFRVEMTARRRTRELLRGPALALDVNSVRRNLGDVGCWDADETLHKVRDRGWYSYVDPKGDHDGFPLLWSFASVMRDQKVLTYRVGRYRDSRDHFAQKRSIGFASLVLEDHQSLFDALSFGICESAAAAVSTDLDIPLNQARSARDPFRFSLRYVAWCSEAPKADLLAFIKVDAPSWFEPIGSRLSLNDLGWMDLRVPPNDIDDFDPWSKLILRHHFGMMHGLG